MEKSGHQYRESWKWSATKCFLIFFWEVCVTEQSVWRLTNHHLKSFSIWNIYLAGEIVKVAGKFVYSTGNQPTFGVLFKKYFGLWNEVAVESCSPSVTVPGGWKSLFPVLRTLSFLPAVFLYVSWTCHASLERSQCFPQAGKDCWWWDLISAYQIMDYRLIIR